MAISGGTTFAGNFTLVSTGSPTNALAIADWYTTINFGASAAAPADLIIQGGTLNLQNGLNGTTGLIFYV